MTLCIYSVVHIDKLDIYNSRPQISAIEYIHFLSKNENNDWNGSLTAKSVYVIECKLFLTFEPTMFEKSKTFSKSLCLLV